MRKTDDMQFSFVTDDGLTLTLRRILPSRRLHAEPVLLVHGAGVRSHIFEPPTDTTLPRLLTQAGHEVWLLDWRASIDIAPSQWTLDQAAVFDYPAAVAKIREISGADTLKAVIHCQGSTSFMMALCAGLLPEVSSVVANAVALHPVV
ncbi:MAG: alpha/beta hydrolase, partial [Pseudomonadales bacterium]|nr:alpha/beta hydrolase [Pseudomonadales bacterium]